MPSLQTTLHLDMFGRGRRQRRPFDRIKRAAQVLFERNVYGLEWGDPEQVPPLQYVRDHFLRPYVSSDTTVLEIGPGGGRWTRYMLHAKQIYAVDYHQELLDELKANLGPDKITFIRNHGDDFPGIAPACIDFVFSFGAFVHLDLDIIDRYLNNLKPLLKPSTNVVIHYSDKTKPLGRENKGFSENDPEKMAAVIKAHGYRILEEDTKTMWHSSVVRFALS